MEISKKEQIINGLEEDFIVEKIEKRCLCIGVEFTYHGRKGSFTYALLGEETGIDRCFFQEKGDEDIWAVIHEWADKHIEFRTIVKYDGKEVR